MEAEEAKNLQGKVKGLQEAVNCIRKETERIFNKITADFTELKRTETERCMTHKFDAAEAANAAVYQIRKDVNESMGDIKEWSIGQLKSTREILETKIAAKVRATLVSSGILFVLLTVLATIVLDTRNAMESTKDKTTKDMGVFKADITTQLDSFRKEMRTEFGEQLREIHDRQIEMNTLIKLHLADFDNDDIYQTRKK